MYDLVNDSVWKRTAELIKEKYGKTLYYRGIKLLSEEQVQKTSFDYYSNGDDLIIPLKSKDHDLGDVIVTRGSLLDVQQKIEVTDLIKFLVEPKVYNLQLKQSEDIIKNNISRSLTLVSTGLDNSDLLINNEAPKKQTLSQIILLKSHTEFSRHRVALKMHEMTERNLFVHLDDIIASVSSKEDIATLSDVTIYIKDIESLSPSTMGLLKDYLETDSRTGPLFLVGSSLSMEAILTQNWPASLKQDLAGFYFDIDRVPLAQQTSEEILDLLFFQFDPIHS